MYEAIIATIETSPHPNADRLQLADAAGYRCIVGLDHADGELGVVFPEGGQLVHEFCMANALYRKHPTTGEPMGGYLEPNRRVRALKLRGVESDALWLPIESISKWLSYVHQLEGHGPRTGVPVFMAGDTLTEVRGRKLCGKYYTPATLRAMRSKNPKTREASRRAAALAKHYDTPQLRNTALPQGDVFITEKLHGTSGRTGFVPVELELSWWAKLLNHLPWVNIRPRVETQYVSGTRNCVLDTDAHGEKGKGFRHMVHSMLAPHVSIGEIWYYEIVGFEDTGTPIMAPHSIGKIGDTKLEKRLKKACREERVVYHYGCVPDGSTISAPNDKPPRFKVYVYRITLDGKELRWDDVVSRVEQARDEALDHHREFLHVVPLLEEHPQNTWIEGELRKRIDELTRGESTQGDLPLREGVCVRVESHLPSGDTDTVTVHRVLKHKSFVFCALEGIRKNDPEYVDAEEIA